MPFAVPLLAVALAVQAVPQQPSGFRADEILRPPGGPEIAVFRSVTPEVVSLRLSIPLEETPSEAGAGQFIQQQATDRMEPLARRIGARAEVHRTPQGMVYQVSGTLADLDFLGWILRAGLEPPSAVDFDDVRRRIQVENDRRMETPQGVLAARVRGDLTPDVPSVYGTTGSLARIDPARLQAIWQRSHRRDRARLVVAGQVPSELALALAADLGLPESASASEVPPGEDTGSPRPSPEVSRTWLVEAFPLSREEEVAALVAGRWLGEQARAAGEDFEVGIEIWDIGRGRRALIVTGVAFPRSVQLMRSRVDTLFEDAAARITEEDVSRAAGAVRTDIIMGARTPWGLAELVGQAWDAGNDPAGVEALLSDLAVLTRSDVVDLFETLSGSTPIREELQP
jgi:hypothetical protein